MENFIFCVVMVQFITGIFQEEHKNNYKNNFMRTKALILAKKQAKNKVRLADPQNIRTRCLGQDMIEQIEMYMLI